MEPRFPIVAPFAAALPILVIVVGPSRLHAQNLPSPALSASQPSVLKYPPAAWNVSGGDPREGLDPSPGTGRYLAYGVSFTSEALLGSGRLCPDGARERCVLGGGGGMAFGASYRALSHSIGAVYEASFHTSNNIYQRGVLQQLRGEWRFRPAFGSTGESFGLFGGAGAGVAMYGDNWAVATLGPSGHAMLGLEWELGMKLSLVTAMAYRAIYFRAFRDATGQSRPDGVTHFFGLQLGFELHDPL